MVLWNVPEGKENGTRMINFVQSLMPQHMKLEEEESIEIMRAHCSPTKEIEK